MTVSQCKLHKIVGNFIYLNVPRIKQADDNSCAYGTFEQATMPPGLKSKANAKHF